MINRLIYWWRSQQCLSALKQGKIQRASRILIQLEAAKIPPSPLVKFLRKYLNQTQEIRNLKIQEQQQFQQIEILENKVKKSSVSPQFLEPNAEIIQSIQQSFKLIDHDPYKLQCTGIDEENFGNFELDLANFLNQELKKYPDQVALIDDLKKALEDVEGLKKGIDPTYSEKLSAYVYLMKYFPDNVYCTYLVWFLIYQAGLLPTSPKILDVAAGPGTVAYGLSLFLSSLRQLLTVPPLHISYYSLEQQELMQFRGLQFWRRYFESQLSPPNFYFRFDSADIFEYDNSGKEIPKKFFDFIVISHCFFYQHQKRQIAHYFYRNIFRNNLNPQGYAILIVQANKLFNLYNHKLSENIDQERQVIQKFLEELGLELEWYKMLTSTDSRIPLRGQRFYHFALQNLPKQQEMTRLRKHYFGQPYESHYAIDDYVIVAKKVFYSATRYKRGNSL